MICDSNHFNRLVWPGLSFPSNPEEKVYQFNDVPGLGQAGWTPSLYEIGAMADHKSFKEQCDEVITTLC